MRNICGPTFLGVGLSSHPFIYTAIYIYYNHPQFSRRRYDVRICMSVQRFSYVTIHFRKKCANIIPFMMNCRHFKNASRTSAALLVTAHSKPFVSFYALSSTDRFETHRKHCKNYLIPTDTFLVHQTAIAHHSVLTT